MPIVAAFCLLTSFSKPAGETIALTKTGTVASILQDLSAQTHQHLWTSDRRGKEILIVDFKGVTASDVMARIGWCTYGTWKQTTGGYELIGDRGAELEAERHYRDWQGKEAAQAVAAFRNRILVQHKPPELSRWEAEQRGNGGPRQNEILLAKALSLIKPETTIYVRPNSVCVYSDQPTPAQYAFTSSVAPILREFNESTTRPAKHMLVSCNYAFEQATAKIAFYDEGGLCLGSAKADFRLYDKTPRPKELADEVPAGTTVPLSEYSKFYVRPIKKWWDWPADSTLRAVPDIVERVQNPEKFEPLAALPTDAWRAVAAWKSKSLCANVDDAYMTPAWAHEVPDLQEAFRLSGGYNAELKDAWLLARPSLPSPPWQHRVDRVALGKLARRKPTDGVEMFRWIGEFSASQEVAPDPFRMTQYLAWARSEYLIDFKLWPTARIFGSLSGPQQQAILSGGAVDLSQAPVRAREALATAQLTRDQDDADLWHQPTVRFPNGLPMTGLLRGGPYDRSAVYVIQPGKDGDEWHGFDYGGAGQYIRNLQATDPDSLRKVKVLLMPMAGIALAAVIPPDPNLSGITDIFSTAPPYYHDPVLWSEAPKWLKDKLMTALTVKD